MPAGSSSSLAAPASPRVPVGTPSAASPVTGMRRVNACSSSCRHCRGSRTNSKPSRKPAATARGAKACGRRFSRATRRCSTSSAWPTARPCSIGWTGWPHWPSMTVPKTAICRGRPKYSRSANSCPRPWARAISARRDSRRAGSMRASICGHRRCRTRIRGAAICRRRCRPRPTRRSPRRSRAMAKCLSRRVSSRATRRARR